MKQKTFVAFFLLAATCLSLSAQTARNTPRLRVSASGGLGYLIASGQGETQGIINTEVINKANENLRRATHLNGDVHYLFSPGWGIGAKYLFQKTSGYAEGVITNYMEVVTDYLQYPHYTVTDFSEKDYINYVGLSLGGLSPIGNGDNFYLSSSISIGHAWLRSELSMLYQNMLITGGNVAMNAEVGFDYLFHPNLGVGLTLGTFVAYFNKIKVTDGTNTQEQKLDKDTRYNASNIHLSAGLRYYINR